MKLAKKVQEWLSHLQWNDELTLDEENQTSSVSFYCSIKNQSFKVWVETDEQRDVLEIYFYAPFNGLSNKLTDCAILFNYINACNKWGAIVCTDTKGTIRWRHSIDFEGTDPSIASIDNAFNVGSNLFEYWFDEISSVALTKTTAKELIDQITTQSEPEQNEELILDLQSEPTSLSQNEIDEADALVDDSEHDALYDDVVLYVTTSRKASISGVQRQFKIGYNRAALIIVALEKKGIVSAAYDNGSRMVLAPPLL